jgi:hypothetical protein
MTAEYGRVLMRLAKGAVLGPIGEGREFGVFPRGDRRRRPLARVSRRLVQTMVSDGAIVASGGDAMYGLTAAGMARLTRETAAPSDAYAAQHAPIVARPTIAADGALGGARGHDPNAAMKRLAALRDQSGKPWFTAAELAVAERLRADWLAGEIGMLRGSDWAAPPQSRVSRGPGSAAESAMIRCCDARARAAAAMASLAGPLRRAVELVCLQDAGFEALERALGWPARSGKLALKLALAQLAARGF